MKNKGFTLIELLVVVAIIGVLASVVLASLGDARSRARDAKKRIVLNQLVAASELYYLDNNEYFPTVGWLSTSQSSAFIAAYVPDYISAVDFTSEGDNIYQYWRKDYVSTGCFAATGGSKEEMAFYVRLENPTAADLATMTDPFDICVRDSSGMDFKAGTQ